MRHIFVCNTNSPREITRKRAVGYTSIKLDEGIGKITPFEVKTEGQTLCFVPTEYADDDTEEEYTILCKEFGLVGYDKCKAKVSIILCDDGYMLVTLHSGGLIVTLDDKLMLPTVGEFQYKSNISDGEIMWIDESYFLSSGNEKWFGVDEGKFIFDIEYMLIVSGGRSAGYNAGSRVRRIRAEDVDMSLGYIAKYEEDKKAKEEARHADEMRKAFQPQNQQTGWEFDDDEDDVVEDVENDDDFDFT